MADKARPVSARPVSARSVSDKLSRLRRRAEALAPGFFVSLIVAIAAQFIRRQTI